MAVAGYVNFGSIKGNSDDANHKEWIEVSNISQGINRNIDPTSKPKQALTKSQVQLGGIEMQKNADESSPELVAAVCKGEVFPEVTIDFVRVSEGGNEVFYQWILTNAYVSSYGILGSSMGGIETTESMTLHYETIKWSYKKKNADGKPAGSVDSGWNLATNATE